MPGWNTIDFNWETLSTFYNAPPGLLLNDLLAAATERWNVLSDTEISHPTIGDNAPLNVNAYNSVFKRLLTPDGFNRFTRPVTGDSYDYTNESAIPHWTMAELINSIGPFPDNGFEIIPQFGPRTYGYHNNAPVTAEWCQWWYHALNKLVRMEYLTNSMMSTMLRSGKGFIGTDETFTEAKTAWVGEPWSTPTLSVVGASQSAGRVQASFNVNRTRSKTDQATFQWKPYLYTGNYTLTAWGKFRGLPSTIYENPDYPCADGTYAKIWDDAAVQSGVYDKDFEFGYFDTITISEPLTFVRREWHNEGATLGNHCRFDVEDGFKYVAQ